MTGDPQPKDKRFKPGQSGNAKGRPPGHGRRSWLRLMHWAKAKQKTSSRRRSRRRKAANSIAAKTILDRVWPPRKGARLQFDLPEVAKAEELPNAIAAINRQAADGDISPDEASLIVGLLEMQRKAIETADLAERVASLEQRLATGAGK